MRAARSHRISAAGVELHALEDAAGARAEAGDAAVVILHGFTGSAETMRGVSQELGERWRRVRIDLVGHGESAVPMERAAYRMASCVAQVRALLAALEIRRPHLLGYSMGGRVALSLCAAEPGAFSSLLAVGASAGIADPGARQARRAADEALAEKISQAGLAAFVDDWMALPLFASQSRLGSAALAEARSQRLRNSVEGLRRSLQEMGSGAQPPLHALLGRLSLPVRFVAGAEDRKFVGISRELAAAMPEARVEEIPEAGHAAHLENPRSFGRVARTFFAEAQRSPKAHAQSPVHPSPGAVPQ